MSVQLDYAVPDPALSDYVTLFYWFRADLPMFEDVERADHAQIRFRLTPGGANYRFADGNSQSVSDAHVVGRRPAPSIPARPARSRSLVRA